jgi:hypothetical protein
LTDNSIAHKATECNTQDAAPAQHSAADDWYDPDHPYEIHEPGLGYGRFLSIARTRTAARFAGTITGLEPFSAVLRALEQLDPRQTATIDLRAVTEADRHNLCSVSVWMLRRCGPVRLLLHLGPVAEMMLTVLPGKPRSVEWDPQQRCLVVDVEATPASAALLCQLEKVADSL